MGLRDVIVAASDPATVMRRVVEEALVLVPAADGAALWLCEPTAGSLVCAAAAGQSRGHLGIEVGCAGSLSGLAVHSGAIQRTSDASCDPRADRAAAAALSIASMICVPLRRGGQAVGVLQVTSRTKGAFGPRDEAGLDTLSAFVSTVIGAAVELASVTQELFDGPWSSPQRHPGRPGCEDPCASGSFVANVLHPAATFDSVVRERIERVLSGSELSVAFQPIVSLHSGAVVEVEALARFSGPPEQGPDRWFAEAAAVGLGPELELFAVETALGHLAELPPPLRMAVNVGPEAFGSTELLALLERSQPTRLVVELTEHVGIDDVPGLAEACRAVRALGARLAIDDTGTGFASLSLVLEMAPEIIKLDRELTRSIDTDPVRRALAGALVGFGRETGAHVVAEGIETAAELWVLRELGVPYGQGFHLARPGGMDDVHALLDRGFGDGWRRRPGRRGGGREASRDGGTPMGVVEAATS